MLMIQKNTFNQEETERIKFKLTPYIHVLLKLNF